jgi:nicotinamide phosphoribosyltransferase
MKKNLTLMTDSYKLGHFKQYPKGTSKVYSYLESRGGVYEGSLFFGLQYYLQEYLEGVRVTQRDIEKADIFCKQHFANEHNFNREGWEYIVKEHRGILPVRIKAVKEGTYVPTRNVLMTIENTDPKCFWLTNVLETLLMKLWYTITISTNSFEAKKIIYKHMVQTGCEDLIDDMINFMLHDFGYRGVSSEEQAELGGASHLVNFMGTDTVAGILMLMDYYDSGMAGFSVGASEHSVACNFGKDKEEEYFLNMIENAYPTGIVSIVSDTYDVYNFVETMSKKFKDKILAREGKVVFRPDSGDPIEVNLRLIKILEDVFGTTEVNGFKRLPAQVGIIQGDGIDLDMIDRFYSAMAARGYAASNWVLGSGGGLLQKFDRDTQKFAIKASYGEKELPSGVTVGFPVQKDPITSKGKKSKAGKLKLVKNHLSGEFTTYSSEDMDNAKFEQLQDEYVVNSPDK